MYETPKVQGIRWGACRPVKQLTSWCNRAGKSRGSYISSSVVVHIASGLCLFSKRFYESRSESDA